DPRYSVGRWDLTDLVAAPVGPAMDAAVDEVKELASEFAGRRSELSSLPSAEALRGLLADRERLERAQRRVDGYAALHFAEDTGNQSAASLRVRIERLLAESRNEVLFFELWWKGLANDAVAELLPCAGEFAYYLETLRRERPYVLSEPEEKLVRLKNVTGIHALQTLYEMHSYGLRFSIEEGGEQRQVTRGELMARASDPSADVRASAYRELLRVYAESKSILGQIYQFVAQDWQTEHVALRKYSSPIARRNVANDLPDDVVDLVLDVCRDNAGLFQKYFRTKAKLLGLPRLRRTDLYAPLAESTTRYAFPDAVELVLDTLSAFSSEMAGMAEAVLADGHLDAEPRVGKDSGAFCYGVLPELTPWVLVNYVGRLDDVSTLAHELGHAIHAQMGRAHPALVYEPSLPLAETASVFTEILLLERLLASDLDAVTRREILGQFIDGVYATVLRQAYFVRFEKEAHEMILTGGATTDSLAQAYAANLDEQFAHSVEIDDAFRWEWLGIPHIYVAPFYCYAYSFGQLLVLALYRAYQQDRESFLPHYARILAYGGSLGPGPILREAGMEITERAFWQGGFDVLREFVEQIEPGG
ncbi:MAG: M3 family oligoendopeptidase, partial [Candidatus Bipolaricaulota bacterium]